ncbi:E3 ubiquitin/ISG15 ligase TRIM25-like [Gigantopelta aegis]|uniref:E3 ubiquitin/ISG15 ligase TRIM25-like n=1 Tax=Gigantopelta aegis TaxID=1735272 RepID=UPI001B889CDD|nr:E3 ubiquitin/ISG15 ligase TRIM25-like [Gigantopelta aegis]XP_041372043.1 E3 ubiquitin/ISG15 ligase TRIM25-like [Gigantopelta aegis]
MASLSSINEDFLTCSICFEPFNDPRILPCVHTFCAECLSNHINSTCQPGLSRPKFSCPTCRESVAIPDPENPRETWAKQFRKNFMISGLRDVVKTEGDSLLTPSLVADGVARHVCAMHPQKERDHFCVDCDKLVCISCIALSHRPCRQVITLAQAAQEKRRQLSRINNLIESYLSRSEAKKSKQKQELDKLTEQYQERKSEILEASAKLQLLIIDAENACVNKLDTLFASHKQEEERVLTEADISTKKLTGMLSAVTDVLGGRDDFRLVDAYPVLRAYQQKVPSMISNEIQVHTLEFVRNMTLYNTIAKATPGELGEVKSVASKQDMVFRPVSLTSTSSSSSTPPPSPSSQPATSPASQNTPGATSSPTVPVPGSLAALTSKPVMFRTLSTKVKSDKSKPSLRDIAVAPGDVIVVTDFSNSCLKSFCTQHGQTEHHSKLVVDGRPHAVSVLTGSTMVATIPKRKLLILVSVTPNLILQSSVHVQKQYWGVSGVSPDVLAVSTCPGPQPGTIELIDLKGTVLKLVTNGCGLFSNPLYLLTLLNKDLVISDCTVPTVVCLRQNGSIIFKSGKQTNPNDRLGFKQPMGMACDRFGSVVIVDKLPMVGIVSHSGEIIQHILTKKDGLSLPMSIAVGDTNDIYVAEETGKVLVFRPTS